MATKPTQSEMDLKEIQELVRILTKSNLNEIEIERKDFRIRLSKGSGMVYEMPSAPMQMIQAPVTPMGQPIQQPVAQPASQAPAAPKQDAGADEDLYTFKSPMIGTFYRSSSPEKDAFVKVGDTVSPGKVLCIVEAMKLFNEIESDISGSIVKILVENAQPVEYDQPLFLIKKG